MFLRCCFALTVISATIGCGDDGAGTVDTSVERPGSYPVGTMDVVLMDAARTRELHTQVWFPAEPSAATAAAAGIPITQLENGANQTTYAGLLAASDPACPTRIAHAAPCVAPAPGPFPVIVVSHCHECTRLSAESIAERLASHGFVVIAVDHTGNTLWDQQAGTGLPLDTTTLAIRVADIRFAIDAALGAPSLIPAEIIAAVDPEHVGVMGHSFGAVTAGLVAQQDPRVDAALALAAPMENPLLPGVTVADLDVPIGFVLAREDNSITELGNNLIRSNYDHATAGAWKAEISDAGHWSVSDLVGLVPGFAAGCKAGVRQTDDQPFVYLDASTGRSITAAYATAFFQAYLRADDRALGYLDSQRPDGTVTSVRK
jgi:dienelactone hydrolase